MPEINKRDHFRVEITVPVKWKLLSEDEIELVKNGMGNTLFKQSGIPSPIDTFLEETPKGSKDEQLFQALKLLNHKLDYIIEQILSRPTCESAGQDNIIEISASGLKFVSEEDFKEGALLKMELIMPAVVQYNIELITEILRATKKRDKFIYGTRIVCINDDAHDSIIKMIFQKQRVDIRNRKCPEEK
ncbi:MAG: PilZ domain-containing protein [Deltaproteobacteria bacterium]|nr:PilZ domain-containing protein [Deltaproteobacteria bacterium]